MIHDWDDDRSVTIRENCHRATPAHGKLLLVEVVLPLRIEPSAANLMITGSDINMLVAVGGRERTEAEFRSLFDAGGFKLTKIVPTQGSLSSVLEGVRV